jgi:hypothetical protein
LGRESGGTDAEYQSEEFRPKDSSRTIVESPERTVDCGAVVLLDSTAHVLVVSLHDEDWEGNVRRLVEQESRRTTPLRRRGHDMRQLLSKFNQVGQRRYGF